jgi:FkbM family methyltransferase
MSDIVKHAKSWAITAGRFLPTSIKRPIFHFAFASDPDEFARFAFDYASAPNQERVLQNMANAGFCPRTIVDVGAYQGEWSKMAKSVWPDAHLIMVEPNKELMDHLKVIASKLKAALHCELLGESDGKEVPFHVMGSGSSVMSERSDFPRTTEVRALITLDSLLAGGLAVDFLKIDAQGYELAIINGAENVLKNVQAVLLEIALIEVNEGCPILHEVLSHMFDRGFVTYDILEMHRRPIDQALCQIDVLFCRPDATIRANKRFE